MNLESQTSVEVDNSLNDDVYNNYLLSNAGLIGDTISITNMGDIGYEKEVESHTPRGLGTGMSDDGKSDLPQDTLENLPRSIISPYFNTRIKGVDGSRYPHNDEVSNKRGHEIYGEVTIHDLIKNRRGASKFDYDDFLYLEKVDILPINRLITLRRFAYPVTDDIFSKKSQGEPDMCRLLTYSTQDENKFSDILSMTMGMRWKPMESSFEPNEMHGTNSTGISGIMGQLVGFFDPSVGQQKLQGSSIYIDPKHDTNKVYGPVDSVANTHIRDVGVDFNQDISLVFNYEMRSINGINQKTAFLDLISNIILMSTNDAKFWGGARYWIGPRPSKYMNTLKDILHPDSWQDFLKKSHDGLKTFAKNNFGTAEKAIETLKNIANNALNILLAGMLNKIGRVGTPLMNSLLTGNPVGLWHLTIGNPLNPILVCGDMLMKDAKLSFGDELGYDDFPTKIKFECTMFNAKPKGRAEIESMFNCGKGRIYFKPKDVLSRKKVRNRSEAVGVQQFSIEQKMDDTDFEYTDVQKLSTELWSFVEPNKM